MTLGELSRWPKLRGGLAGRSFAAGAPPLMHVYTAISPPAPAAQRPGVGLQPPCRGKVLGGMVEAVARIAPEQLATMPNGSTSELSMNSYRCV